MNKLLLQAIRRYGKEGVASPTPRSGREPRIGGNRVPIAAHHSKKVVRGVTRLRVEDLVNHLVNTHILAFRGEPRII